MGRHRQGIMLTTFALVLATGWIRADDLAARTDRHGDPLPPYAVARLGTVRWKSPLRDSSGSAQVSLSPDGKYVVSEGCCGFGVWDVGTGKLVPWLPDVKYIGAVAFSPDGKTLLIEEFMPTGDNRERLAQKWRHLLRRWEVGTGKPQGEQVFEHTLRGSRFSTDTRLLIGMDGERTIRTLDAATAKPVQQIEGELYHTSAFALSGDNRRLAALGRDGCLRVYDVERGQELLSLRNEDDVAFGFGLRNPALSPDGRLLAATTRYALRLWDVASGRLLKEFESGEGVSAFSADGKLLAHTGAGALRLYDVAALTEVRTLEGPHGYTAALAFSADGKRLVAASSFGLRLWEVATGQRLNPPVGHEGGGAPLVFSPRGDRLAGGGANGEVIVWDVKKAQALHRFSGSLQPTISLAFSSDGKMLAAGDGSSGGMNNYEAQVLLWDAEAGQLIRQFTAHLHGVHSVHFSPDGKRLATAGGDDRMRMWDAATGERLYQVRGARWHRSTVFSPDGRSLLVRGSEGELALRRAADGGLIRELGTQSEQRRQIYGAAFFAGGSALWSVESGGRRLPEATEKPPRLRLWDAESGREVRSISVRADTGTSYLTHAISADGTTFATAGEEYEPVRGPVIYLWDVVSGKEMLRLTGLPDRTGALALSPGGDLLASSHSDDAILLWDVARTCLQKLWDELAAAGDAEAVRAASADPARAVPFLRDRLKKVAAAEPAARQLLPRLDEDDFKVREEASRELLALPPEADFALGQALEDNPSAEMARRLREELPRRREAHKAAAVFAPANVRAALSLLQRIKTADARRAVEELARGPDESAITREARHAVERRPEDPPRP